MVDSRLPPAEHESARALHQGLPLPSTIRQIDGIQILRAVAVIIVAWVHIGQEVQFNYSVLLPSLGIFGVDIFFVISGFILGIVILRSRREAGVKTAWHFLSRRILRIFPIFWIFAFLGFARLYHGRMFDPNLLPSFFLLPYPAFPHALMPLANGWTLVFEWFFYCLLAVVQIVTVRRALQTVIATLSVVVALGLVIDIQHPVLVVVMNPILLEFCLGAVLALVYFKWGAQPQVGKVLLGMGTIMAILLGCFFHGAALGPYFILRDHLVFGRVGSWGISATLIVLGMLLWSPVVGSIGRVFVALGNASYSIYLAEGLAQILGFRLADPMRHFTLMQGTGGAWLIAIAVLTFKLGFGWLIYRVIELPMLRKLQKVLGLKP